MNKYAIIFSGHGAYSSYMPEIFKKNNPIIKKTFDLASSCIKYNLWKGLNNNEISNQKNQKYLQPLLLTISVTLFKLWIKKKFSYSCSRT
ncbi:hypothetical protein [Buchnera aphidicola]|uniref:hypothetical protein n=1 Tax=Buchnera aphidicola TaxID=9 RepID=UPI0031B7EB9B